MSHAERPDNIYIPDHLQPIFHPGGALVLDIEANRYKNVTNAGAELLEVVNQNGELDAVHAWYAGLYPQLSSEEVAVLSTDRLQKLSALGMVDFGEKRGPKHYNKVTFRSDGLALTSSASTYFDVDNLPFRTREYRPSLLESALAIRAIITSLAVKRSLKKVEAHVRHRKEATTRIATYEEALHAKTVVEKVAYPYPGRFACLESTVATILFASYRGLRIDAQFGVSFMPPHFHIWPNVEGRAIAFADDLRDPTVFHHNYAI